MATNLKARSPLITSLADRPPATQEAAGFNLYASRGVGVAGVILLLGSLLDLAVLWVLQHQGHPQWELVALANTAEAFPRLVLSIGFLYVALHIAGSRSLAAHRILAGTFVVFALAAAAIGGMMVSNYFVLSRLINPEAASAFETTVVKTVALSGLYFLLLLPLGLLGLRRPRS